MRLVEKQNTHKNKRKTNRKVFYEYQKLLWQAEELGVVSLDFGNTTSLTQKMDILRNILRQVRCNKKEGR